MTLFGTTIGVLLNLIFPAYLIVLSLFAIMLFSIWKTILNLRKLRADAARAPVPRVVNDDEAERNTSAEAASLLAKEEKNECVSLLSSQTLWSNVLILGIWLFIFATAVMKGGGESPVSIVKACSWAYWLLFGGVGPILYGFTFVVGLWLRSKTGVTAIPSPAEDIKWNRRNTLVYPWIACAAGLAAGLMGVGSGVVIGPLLLELGMRPETGSATTAFMILFTSSSVTVQFLILGRLPPGYSLPLVFAGFATGLIGKYGINELVKKYNKPYYLVGCLILFLVSGTAALGALGIYQIIIGQAQRGFSVEPVCNSG